MNEILVTTANRTFGKRGRAADKALSADAIALPAADAAALLDGADLTNDNKQPVEDVYLGIAWKAFVDRIPNALGEGAMKIDDGGRYAAAVNHPHYYLHHANKRLFATRSQIVANRVNGIRHAIVFGQGPGEVFAEQEALMLEQLPKLEEVTTIEFSQTFNDEAEAVVRALSEKVGRPIKHNKITESFEKAARNHPELLSPEKKLVINSGSTIMNLADVPGEFPRRELQSKLAMMKEMAGDEGFVLITYDSYREDKVPAKLAAYSTPEAKELFLHAIDELAAKRPELTELKRENFEYIVEWDKDTFNAGQKLRVVHPIHIYLRYKGDHETIGTFRGMQEAGEDYQIINSFMPEIEEVEASADEIGLSTVMTIEDETDNNYPTGFAMQLMKAKPKAPVPGVA